MSDFIAANLHKKVDHIMDVFYGAGVASHPTIIEQINYLLFMRALSQRDDELRLLGVNDKNEIVFDGELEKYHWDNLLALNAEALFTALEDCFRKIPESTTNKTVRLVFRNAHLKLFDKPSLRTVLHEIDAFGKEMDDSEHAGKRDVFGDTYEYLLSKLAQAGTSGQFRTPRHIIEFIVNVVAPQKGETILDPAVGTAGFLVKAFEHLRKEYTSPETLSTGGQFDKLTSSEMTFLLEHTFTGFDSDEDMIKFGMMNLYLHGLKDAKLVRQNTLTDTAGSRDKYDVIVANPPFSGKIDRDSVAEELQMNTGATEVLFLRYMLRHLTDNGRLGVIVPEGILFNTNNAYKKIRELLIDNGLWCVLSLPAGVFNPYAGVKTSILFVDKQLAKKFNRVIFVTANADGFDLSANRRPIPDNDLPNVEKFLGYCKAEIEKGNIRDDFAFPFVDEDFAISVAPLQYHFEKVERIKDENSISFQVSRYNSTDTNVDHQYPLVELGEVLDYEQPQKYIVESVNYSDDYVIPVLTAGKTFILGKTNEKTSVFPADKLPVIIFDDFTTATKFVDFQFKVKSSAMKILHAKEGVDIRYVFAAMKLINFEPKEHKRFWISEYSKLKIPLPPIEIQRKIVAEIENKQKAIGHAREIIKTLERERAYFDPSARAARENWPVIKIGEVFKTSSGGTPLKSKREYYDGGTIPWLGSGEVARGEITKSRNFITELALKETSVKLFPKNSVLIAMYGATVGQVGILRVEATTNQAICAVFPDPSRALPEYLYAVLLGAKSKLVALSAGGAQPNISQQIIKNFEIPLPPLETQREIANQFAEEAAIIAANRKLINIYEQKIADTLANI